MVLVEMVGEEKKCWKIKREQKRFFRVVSLEGQAVFSIKHSGFKLGSKNLSQLPSKARSNGK